MDEHKENLNQDELTPDELKKLVQIEELTESGDVVPVPAQINYGISIFAMTDGPPVVHVTQGQLSDDDEVPLPWLIELLRQAADNLLFESFMRNLAARQLAHRQRMAGQEEQG